MWTEEGRKRFEEYFGKNEEGEGEVEKGWGKLKKRVGEMARKVEKELKGGERKGWWDEECKEQKRKVREELRRWKEQGGEGGKCKMMKSEYRKLCEEKKRKEGERWEKEIEGVRTERQVWRLVARERRRRRRRMEQGIEMEEWERYFKDILGGVEWKVRREGGRTKGDEVEEEEISREEIGRVIRKLKEGKSAGGDGIVNEVWKYGGRR